MKDIDDMRIGESFYLKRTVAVISTRTGKPCEFDEERIDINDLIIEELESLKYITQVMKENSKYDKESFDLFLSLLDSRIADLKGE